MTRRAPAALLILALGATAPRASAQSAPAGCATADECRGQTEAAIAQGDFELAHDLAWRTMQRGPRNDSGLMYLLARAQALSGRPDDALVMLRRLAEMGLAPDTSGDEFRRTRDLAGWPAVETLITGTTNPLASRKPLASATSSAGSNPAPQTALLPSRPTRAGRRAPVALAAPATAVAPPAPAAPDAPDPPDAPDELAGPTEPPVDPLTVDAVGSFSSADFAPGGLACDAVSRRFVFGDRMGRKLRILAEGADGAIDLTREASAGFLDVMALDIDTTRGDLWVVSAQADGSVATVHKLQLVSGRALARYDVPADLAPVKPADLAVTASGTVLVLDALRSRVIALRPGAAALELAISLNDVGAVSLALGNRDGTGYVAHRDGISRFDLRSRTTNHLAGPAGTNLRGIDRLRRTGRELIGVQALSDGSRRLVRLVLDAQGLAITRLQVVGVALPATGPPALTAVCDDTVALLVGGTADRPPNEWTFRRIRLPPLTRIR
jgi:hypothetical protein